MASGTKIALAGSSSNRDEPLDTSRLEDRVPTEALLRAALEVALARVPGPIVLAVSGGRDSMALMHAMARWAPGRLAAVATYDHATGGYATEAASLVVADARRLGLTNVRERSRTPARTEAGWRAARWRFLHRVARAYGAQVATAHTRDDQVETIVMRVLRGTGARGLAALAAPSPIVRPWLPVGRAEVAVWAAAESVPFLEDPMNAERRYMRGRVRHELLPAFERVRPGFSDDLLGIGERAAAWRRDVDALVDTLGLSRLGADAMRPTGRDHALRVPVAPFAATTDGGRAVLWPACFARLGVVLDARGTQALVRFSKTERRGAWITVAGGATVVRAGQGDDDWFELRRPSRAGQSWNGVWTGAADALPPRLGAWRFRRMSTGEANMAINDRWYFGVPLHSTVTIRGWHAGDRIQTSGAPAGRRVTRYFSDAHIPALDRAGWPVVLVDGALLCVPGLCRARAAPHRPGSPDSIWYQCECEQA